MYTREPPGGAPSQIWEVDVFGRNERRVATPGAASDPAWSPLIQ
jgi:TolB protein